MHLRLPPPRGQAPQCNAPDPRLLQPGNLELPPVPELTFCDWLQLLFSALAVFCVDRATWVSVRGGLTPRGRTQQLLLLRPRRWRRRRRRRRGGRPTPCGSSPAGATPRRGRSSPARWSETELQRTSRAKISPFPIWVAPLPWSPPPRTSPTANPPSGPSPPPGWAPAAQTQPSRRRSRRRRWSRASWRSPSPPRTTRSSSWRSACWRSWRRGKKSTDGWSSTPTLSWRSSSAWWASKASSSRPPSSSTSWNRGPSSCSPPPGFLWFCRFLSSETRSRRCSRSSAGPNRRRCTSWTSFWGDSTWTGTWRTRSSWWRREGSGCCYGGWRSATAGRGRPPPPCSPPASGQTGAADRTSRPTWRRPPFLSCSSGTSWNPMGLRFLCLWSSWSSTGAHIFFFRRGIIFAVSRRTINDFFSISFLNNKSGIQCFCMGFRKFLMSQMSMKIT